METSDHFTGNIDGWIVWARSGWKNGWINLRATPAQLNAGERRKTFALGWNGERFARSGEMARLSKHDPDAEHVLQAALVTKLPKPLH